ncbi:hypothetical protein ACT3HK_10770 [Thermolongibacillus altinsuensis]
MSEYKNSVVQKYKEITPSRMKVKQVYPVREIDGATVGFKVTKEQAIQLAIQILVFAQVSEEIEIRGVKEDDTVFISQYK